MTAPEPLLTHDGRPAADLWPDSGLVHLNHGSYGRVPLAASERQRELREEMERGTLAFMARGPERIAAARERIAPFLSSSAEHLALVPNASAGISTVLRSLPPAAGTEILVTNHVYGAVRMGIERTAGETGASVRVVDVRLAADAEEATETIWAAVTERTATIVLDQITSGTARRLPVAQITARARERGILTIVDGAHAPLLDPAPVTEADADVWVGNLHKFGCTPRGTAVLVARPEVADRLRPLIDSWGAPDPFPHRFDWQASDDYSAWLAAPDSLQHLADELGWERIRAHATAMATYAVERVGAALVERFDGEPFVDVGIPVGPIRLLALPEPLASARAPQATLLAAGFETQFSTLGGRLHWRVAPHAYTTPTDVDAFVDRGLDLLATG